MVNFKMVFIITNRECSALEEVFIKHFCTHAKRNLQSLLSIGIVHLSSISEQNYVGYIDDVLV